MPFIRFADLTPRNDALTDVSSLRDLANKAGTLTCPLTPTAARLLLTNLGDFGLRPSLNLLERWIVVDRLVADLVALDTVTGGKTVRAFRRLTNDSRYAVLGPDKIAEIDQAAFISHMKGQLLDRDADPSKERELADIQKISRELSISFTAIPSVIFAKCVPLILETSHAMQKAQPQTHWNDFGFGYDKEYVDLLDKRYEVSQLARSHLGVERTLVYFEISAIAGIPLVLHSSRYTAAVAINSACVSAYESVKSIISETFEEPIRSQLTSIGVCYDVRLPPLVSRLIDIAAKEGVSIIDAAKQIKQSGRATEFRKWLAEMQVNLADNTKGGKLEALRMLQELKRVAHEWVADVDTKAGVTYKKRELRLSMVPRIGALLEFLGNRSIKVPILNRKGYLTFVSWWFDHEI